MARVNASVELARNAPAFTGSPEILAIALWQIHRHGRGVRAAILPILLFSHFYCAATGRTQICFCKKAQQSLALTH